MQAKTYLDELVSKGRYFFTVNELDDELPLSRKSILVSLHRLKRGGEIASLAKGYYIIIPMEYRSLGSLPPDQFVPDLMNFLHTPYYVGLLSAAMYYGAAHQQPQIFQVMTPNPRRNISVGKVRVEFYTNKYLDQCPIRKFNTPKSVLNVSSPEATALDLITYIKASGGLSNTLTVLRELTESIERERLLELLSSSKREPPTLQRFGYFMDLLNEEGLAATVEKHLKEIRCRKALLNPLSSQKDGRFLERWKLIINEQAEADL